MPQADILQWSYFYFLGRKSGLFTVNGLFCLMPKGMEGLKMFSLENEKTKDYFFFGHTKRKLKTIEVGFIYSKRSAGF